MEVAADHGTVKEKCASGSRNITGTTAASWIWASSARRKRRTAGSASIPMVRR